MAAMNATLQKMNQPPAPIPPVAQVPAPAPAPVQQQAPVPPHVPMPPQAPIPPEEVVPPPAPVQALGPDQERAALDHFLKQGPGVFKGVREPLEAEEWIASLEKIFRAIGGTDSQKVTWAVYRLRGEADQWWRMIERTIPAEEIAAMTWEGFKGLFLGKYFPSTEKAKMEAEFLYLQQGETETVLQYEERFTRLSRFAEYMIAPEERKVSKFVQGLRPYIGNSMLGQWLPTYRSAVDRALAVESGKKRYQEMREASGASQSKKRLDSGKEKQQQGKKPSVERNPQCPQCFKYHKGECLRGKNVCYECGQQGHMAINCPRNQRLEAQQPQQNQQTSACFNCGEVGHFSRNCPKPWIQRPQQPQGPQQPQRQQIQQPQQQNRAPARVYALTEGVEKAVVPPLEE